MKFCVDVNTNSVDFGHKIEPIARSRLSRRSTVAPAFRCETGRENAVVRVISLTIQSVYSVAML